MYKTDLIIIGGGALGTFHALHALENGLTVRLFEKNKQPQGATVRNFGQVVPSGMNAKWQAYGRESLAIYKNLQKQFDITLRPLGSIYIASNEEETTLLEELAGINRHNDYPSELLTAEACLQKYPGLRADYCRGGLFFPQEITVESREMIHRVLQYLVSQKGLIYHANTLVRQVEKGNVTDSTGREYQAAKILVCSGDEFRILFPDLFAASDLEVSKLQMLQTVPLPTLNVPGNILTGLTIRRYESFSECPSYTSIKAKEDPSAVWKKWGVHILFKQCPDGSFILGDSHEYADAAHADDLRFDIHPEINEYMLKEAKAIFQFPDWTIQRVWSGQYAQSKNSDVFRYSPEEDVHILTGIGGKGMTGSAGFARQHLADIFNRSISNHY